MDLKGHEVDLVCPTCRHPFRIKLGATMSRTTSKCPKCGTVYKRSGNQLAEVETSLDQLTDQLKRAFKAIK